MIQLYFNLVKFPRSIGKTEWKKIWRWKRVTQKKLVEEAIKQQEMLATYGSTMPDYVRRDIIENMINPPLLIHDRMDIT